MKSGGGVSIDGTLLAATMIHGGIEHWSELASGRSHQARWDMGPMKGVGAETKDAAGPAPAGRSGLIDLVATLALISASAVVTWWAVGDLSYTGPSSLGTQQDYLIHPLNLASGAGKLLGAVSVAVVVVAGAALLRTGSAPRRDRRWLAVLLPLLVTGIFVGGGWRVVASGGVGANIGGGLLIFFGGPLVVAVLVWSLIYSWRLLTRERGANQFVAAPEHSITASARPPARHHGR